MAVGEQEFIIRARDELTATLKQLQAAVGDFGTQSKTQFDRAARGGDGYRAWQREQMRDQRSQNFLFRQLREVTGAAALGITFLGQSAGATSPKMKNLTDGLTQGFIAFQGIEFALGAINPMLGLVAGGIAGLAIAFKEFDSVDPETIKAVATHTGLIVDAVNKVENSKVDALIKYIAKLNEISQGQQGVPASVEKAKKVFGELQAAAPDLAGGLARALGGKGAEDDLNRQTAILVAQQEQLKKIAGLRKELADKGVSQADIEQQVFLTFGNILPATDAVANSTEKVVGVNRKYLELVKEINDAQAGAHDKINGMIAAQFPLQAKITETFRDRLTLAVLLGDAEFNRLADAERALRIEAERRKPLQEVAVSRPDIGANIEHKEAFDAQVLLTLQSDFKSLGVTAENTAGLITSSMQGAAAAIVDTMFGATNSILQLFENLAKSIATLFVEEILKRTVASFVGDVLGFIGFAAGTSVAPGPIPEEIPPAPVTRAGIPPQVVNEQTASGRPVGRTIIVNLNGQPLNVNPTDRKRFTELIGDAVFAEKIAW
jgi:hypothetical protein